MRAPELHLPPSGHPSSPFAGVLRRLPVPVVVAAAGALTLLGAWLLPRPLTATGVLQWAAAAAAVVAGALLIARRPPRPLRRVLGAAAVAAGAGLVAWPWVAVPLLPGAALVVGTVLLVRRARRGWSDARGSARLLAASGVVACVLLAVPVVVLPDVAQLLLAWAFAAALIVAGPALLARRLRRDRSASGSRSAARTALAATSTGIAVVLAGALAAGSIAVGVVEPRRPDAFTTWTGALPAEPGQLLRAEPWTGTPPAGATVTRILYSTTDAAGAVVLSTGLVAIPDAPADERLVVAWQHGTKGIARSCAPSLRDDALAPTELPGIEGAIERGWAVVATDYPGLGTAGDAAYLIGEGSGRAVLDAIRAARTVDAGLGADVLLWGHSQGGHATLWAGQIAASYAPELQVRGVAALSSASDPLRLARTMTGGANSPLPTIITSYVLRAYDDAYAELDRSTLVDPAARALVDSAAGRCVSDTGTVVSVAVAAATAHDRPVFDLDLDGGAVHERLAQNAATGIVDAPLLLAQGADDEVVPIGVQRALASTLCAAERTVVVREYPGRTHLSVVAPDSPLVTDLLDWSDRVVAGGAPVDCAV